MGYAGECHNVDLNDDELGGVVYISGYEADILIQNSTFKSNQTTDQSHFIVLHQTKSPRIANSFFLYVEKDHPSFISHIGLQQSTPLTIRFWNNTFLSGGQIARKSAGKGFTNKAKLDKRIVSSEVSPVQFTGNPICFPWVFLPPAYKVCEVYDFTGVCLSTGSRVRCRGHSWQGEYMVGVCVPV